MEKTMVPGVEWPTTKLHDTKMGCIIDRVELVLLLDRTMPRTTTTLQYLHLRIPLEY